MPREQSLDVARIRDDLLFWEYYEPSVRCVLSSVAIRAAGAWVLVDPIWTGDPGLALLSSLSPAAVVATSGNHARACARFADTFAIPLLASQTAATETGATSIIAPGETPLPGINILEMSGGGPGEIALWCPDNATLCFGDALVHLPSTGLAILPDKYCSSPKLLRENLDAAAALRANTFTFAHGPPLLSGATTRLLGLLA